MTSSVSLWLPPLVGALFYHVFVVCFQWANSAYQLHASVLSAACALLMMLMMVAVPAVSARGLLLMRHEQGVAAVRGVLYLACTVPSLYSLVFTLSRFSGVHEYLAAIWIALWGAVGLLLPLGKRSGDGKPKNCAPMRASIFRRLRLTHGVTALCLLLGFLIAHLANHSLAAWSVSLHRSVMNALRLWYRSGVVEPVLLSLMLGMVLTGIPMVLHYSRRQMDGFRVAQVATGAYLAVFLCSHVFATLYARSLGVDTDWSFAAGPVSLLASAGMLGRLIPHYLLATLSLMVHVACGLRVVLLHHRVPKVISDRVFYGLAGVGVAGAALIMAALLGVHLGGAF